MTYKHLILCLGFAVLLGILLPAHTHAQTQKHPYQKGRPSEALREEPLQQGGYQAPPPTGALQGPTSQLGLSGGEIEIPAIRLRLPRIRLPAFSRFVTPPRMQLEGGVAPLVEQVREQISVPAGKAELRSEPFRAPKTQQPSSQKASFQPGGRYRLNTMGPAPQTTHYVQSSRRTMPYPEHSRRSPHPPDHRALQPRHLPPPTGWQPAPNAHGRDPNRVADSHLSRVASHQHPRHHLDSRRPQRLAAQQSSHPAATAPDQPPARHAIHAASVDQFNQRAETLTRQVANLERLVEDLRDQQRHPAPLPEQPQPLPPQPVDHSPRQVIRSQYLRPVEAPTKLMQTPDSSSEPTPAAQLHQSVLAASPVEAFGMFELAAAAVLGCVASMAVMWLVRGRNGRTVHLVSVDDARSAKGLVQVLPVSDAVCVRRQAP